jgi:hypothetical protein
VQDYGNWGRITETFLPTAVQTDLNMGLDPAFRWSPDGQNSAMAVGAHVAGIRLTEGVLKTNIDTFIHHGDFPMAKPFELTWSETAVKNAAFKPQSVTVDAATSDAASQFTTPRAGNYYYAVAAIGAGGEGLTAVVKSAQTAVAAGKKAVLTITASAAGTESGYAIYRSRQNGTNETANFRLVKIIPKAGATTVSTGTSSCLPAASASLRYWAQTSMRSASRIDVPTS